VSQPPTRPRPWAQKVKTLVIAVHVDCTHISIMAGVSRKQRRGQLHAGSIKREQHAAFVKVLRSHFKQKRLIIWVGLKAQRSTLLRDDLDPICGDIRMADVPPYSPHLSPVQFL